jgi:putative membrane protein
MAEAEQPIEARRLHPTTLFQRVLLSVPTLIIVTLPLWTTGDRSVLLMLFFGGAYALFALPMIVAHYLRFRYWITPQQMVIESGVFTRKHRSIPIERIQNIEIRQSLLPRMFGTARVQIETAGSKGAEGTLEFVSLAEAHSIRHVVRQYQRGIVSPAPAPTGEAVATEGAPEDTPESTAIPLISLPLYRVLMSGMMRFSLLYILLIFSGIHYLNLEPDEMLEWFTRGRFQPVSDAIATSPWTVAVLTVAFAALFSWLMGIFVNLNRYFRFRLALEGDKLYRRHGLMTVTEGTIPLKKVQAIIFRANPLMRHLGYCGLEVQTMGLDADERGNQAAVPFARVEEVLAVTPAIRDFTLPDTFLRVSPLMIRRTAIRYSVLLALLVLPFAYFWSVAYWGFALWPVLLVLAWLQYRNHGYRFDGRYLFVRRGVIRHVTWVLPIDRFQVLYASASIFQRRLGLSSVLVDTAGASTLFSPEISDLREEDALALLDDLYLASQAGAGIRTEPLTFHLNRRGRRDDLEKTRKSPDSEHSQP